MRCYGIECLISGNTKYKEYCLADHDDFERDIVSSTLFTLESSNHDVARDGTSPCFYFSRASDNPTQKH